MNYLALSITLTIALTFALVAWVLHNESARGWQPLATVFPLTERPTGHSIRLRWISIGGRGLVGHKSMVVASVSPAGLTLQMPLLAWLCYPAMRIPWSAFSPFRAEKRFILQTRYTTLVRLPDGTSVPLRIGDADLIQAAQPWIKLEALY